MTGLRDQLPAFGDDHLYAVMFAALAVYVWGLFVTHPGLAGYPLEHWLPLCVFVFCAVLYTVRHPPTSSPVRDAGSTPAEDLDMEPEQPMPNGDDLL